eukprot:3431268-Prymnesium_polylepis.1
MRCAAALWLWGVSWRGGDAPVDQHVDSLARIERLGATGDTFPEELVADQHVDLQRGSRAVVQLLAEMIEQ